MDSDTLGLIGDVHAEDLHLEVVLAFMRERGVDRVLCAGDVVDGRGDANRCCDLLASASALTVRGNHDEWCLEDRVRDLPDAIPRDQLTPSSLSFLSGLPATRSLSIALGGLLLCHGLGENNMALLRPYDEGYDLEFNTDLHRLLARPGLRVVVAGHSHRKMVRTIEQVTFINAGSLIPERDCGFLVYNTATGAVEAYGGLEGGRVSAVQHLGRLGEVA